MTIEQYAACENMIFKLMAFKRGYENSRCHQFLQERFSLDKKAILDLAKKDKSLTVKAGDTMFLLGGADCGSVKGRWTPPWWAITPYQQRHLRLENLYEGAKGMEKEVMAPVSRVPQSMSGTSDTVEMTTKCNVTTLAVKGDEVGIKNQQMTVCRLLASFENGTVGISVRGDKPYIVTVRLDEMMALLKEAADFSMESRKTGDLHETKSDQPTEE